MKKYLPFILSLLMVGCVTMPPIKFYKVSRDEQGQISETHITRGFPFVENQQVTFKDWNTGKWETFHHDFQVEIIP